MALLSIRKREQITQQLQVKFDREVERLAKQLLEKGSRTRDFHRGMKRLITDHLLQQSMVGKGGPLTRDEIARLSDVLKEQQAFLSRFADKTGLKRMRHEKVTLEGLIHQGRQYAGAGRAEYERSRLNDAPPDAKVYFVSRDDNGTCSPCLSAEEGSPYEIGGSVPLPGAVCLSAGRCRCQLEVR